MKIKERLEERGLDLSKMKKDETLKFDEETLKELLFSENAIALLIHKTPPRRALTKTQRLKRRRKAKISRKAKRVNYRQGIKAKHERQRRRRVEASR